MKQKPTVYDSEARMKRGLVLLESNGKSIKENADGSFAVPSQTSDKIYEVRFLGADKEGMSAPVLILNIVKSMLANTFMQSSYGLLLGLNYKMSLSLKSLLMTLFHALIAIISGLSNTVMTVVSKPTTARIASASSDSHP